MTSQRTHNDNTVTEPDQTLREKEHNTTSSTTTTYHTEPGVLCTPVELEQIRTVYEDVIGRLNMVKARDIEEALRAGVTAEGIVDALEQTAMAPRPSHYYLRAILRRYAERGIYTIKDAERDRYIRRAQQRYAREEREAWYKPVVDDDPWA